MKSGHQIKEPLSQILPFPSDSSKEYIISMAWYSNYLNFQYGGPNPGKIKNSNLLDLHGKLKSSLLENIDYKSISEEEWNDLLSRFGSEEESINRVNRSSFRSVSSAGYGDETHRDELMELKIPVSARKEFDSHSSKSFENNSKVNTVDSENQKNLVLNVSSKSGLQKFENSHIINSVLQILFTIEPLVDYFVQNSGIGQFFNSEFLVQFAKLCLSVTFLHSGIIFTQSFSENLSLANKDPASVIQQVINKIDLELGSDNLLQSYVLDGILNIENQCLSCTINSSYLMKFLYLQVKCSKSVENSLEIFSRSTTSNGFCEHCQKETNLQKRMTIHHFPNFFILIINRNDENNEKKFKVCQYKRKLKLQCTYRLVGIVANYTNGYASYCKRKKNWFLFDDEKFSKVQTSSILSNVAHVLLYKKINN